jgi:hypothetical protein
VPRVWISFGPVLNDRLDRPRIQSNLAAETGQEGHFVSPQVPPVKARLKAQLSVWRDSPLTLRRSVPPDLRSGDRVR